MRFEVVIWISLVWAGLLNASPSGGTATFTKLKLHIESHPVSSPIYHGYTAHRFTVDNFASEKKRITFTLPFRGISSEDFNIRNITRSFTISPGSQTVTILQPPLPMGWIEEVKITCDGQQRSIPRGIALRMSETLNCGLHQPRVVFVSRSINQTTMEKAIKACAPKGGGSGSSGPHHYHGRGGPHSDVHAEFLSSGEDLPKWPRHWLAYSCYDMIILRGIEWNQAPSDIRSAIERWVLCGGKLAIIGSGYSPPSGWKELDDTLLRNIGIGEVKEYESDSENTFKEIALWLGADDPENNQGTIPIFGGLQKGVDALHHTWNYNDRDFNSYFPVIGEARTPVRLIIIVLTIFVLLAGPVNLFILNNKGKRAWFLWTLPAISFATSTVVFVVSFFSEGLTPRLKTQSLTLLNQIEQEATTLGAIAVYAPIAPSKLNFSGQTEVTPLFQGRERGPFGGSRQRDSGSNRQVEWSAGGEQRLTGKWVGSRVPAHFAIRKSEHREERLQVDWSGAAPKIINGLGCRITRLYLSSPEGKIYEGSEIGPGKNTLLKPVAGGLKSKTSKDNSTTSLAKQIADLADQDSVNTISPEKVPPNCYWAQLSEPSPFLEDPLKGRNSRHRTSGHIIGILAQPEDLP